MALANQKIVVIIPALNEEQALPLVLRDLPGFIDQVIVGDNGSTDNTAQVARAAGAIVVTEPQRGYGAACLVAIAEVPADTAILLFIDGDYSDYPEEAEQIVGPVVAGKFDLVIGSRMATRK